LASVPPDQIDAVRAASEQTLGADPRDHRTRANSPVLALFGADDMAQPTDRSARLYSRYLDQAGNDDVTIITLPDVGHDIVLSTPGYWEQLTQWLDHL
jgi:pimeloyl-ACP methyl ester carboxylesterase